jgi:hypothetical protein
VVACGRRKKKKREVSGIGRKLRRGKNELGIPREGEVVCCHEERPRRKKTETRNNRQAGSCPALSKAISSWLSGTVELISGWTGAHVPLIIL